MQFIQNILSVNQILTASLLSWFIAQVLKTIINFVLLGKFQLERMWGDGGMPSAHSATVCAMAIVTGRSAGISSPIFAVACVVDDVLDVTSTPEQLGKPIGSDSENGKTTFVTLYGADGAMALAQKLNEQICDDLQQHFGVKAAFLQQLAQQLLVRKN